MTKASLRGDADVRRPFVVKFDDPAATAEVRIGPGDGMTQLNPNEVARVVLADRPALPRIRVARPRARQAAPPRRRGSRRVRSTVSTLSESPLPEPDPGDTPSPRSPLALLIGGVR